MADVFSKKKRSEIMARIRAKNTGIEKVVFSHLRKRGVYFRMHYDRVRGRPDVALPSKKIAVFIDGDFWHGYRFNTWRNRIPKEYWREKIAANISRDRRNRAALRRRGWRVLRVWGHDLSQHRELSLKKITLFLLK
jgi:DNA mismatch endonuclease (patch repair protein)